jgi:hypothetical protein
MKKLLLTGALTVAILVLSAAAADAQVQIDYTKKGKNYTFQFTYNSGYYYGYGGYGYGYTGYPGTFYGGYGGFPGYTYGGSYGGVGTYGTGYYRPYYPPPYNDPYYGSRPVQNYSPVYSQSPMSAERMARIQMQKDVEEGLARFKKADYRGATDAFRRAFLADTDSAMMQLLLGAALAGAGDSKNADKAFRSAFESLKPEEALGFDLPKRFRDMKEEERYVSRLDGLSAGVVAFLRGDKEKARAELGEVKDDPAARKLLDHLGK